MGGLVLLLLLKMTFPRLFSRRKTYSREWKRKSMGEENGRNSRGRLDTKLEEYCNTP
jgi:hypothetical protein